MNIDPINENPLSAPTSILARRPMRWRIMFGVYFAAAAVCLLASRFATPPIQNILFMLGAYLLVGIFPLMMAYYFLRGFLKLR